MLDRHANLYLDTTMVVAGYFPVEPAPGLIARRADRLLYGTDFPNLPYAWDREARLLAESHVGAQGRAGLRALMADNALRLFTRR